MNLPAADLLYENARGAFTRDLRYSRDLGFEKVDGKLCHHLAFGNDAIDWELWLSQDQPPMLRQLAIDYKLLKGRPRYTLGVRSMKQLENVDADTFVFHKPKGAERIEIQPVSKLAGTKR